MTFLTGALILFGIFHFFPYSRYQGAIGWEIWQEIFFAFQNADIFKDVWSSMAVASFLMFTLLILTSPFLGTIWNKSKLAWSMALTCSGLATAGFWLNAAANNTFATFLPGAWCLMFAPVLNFFGLLFACGKSETPMLIPPGTGDAG